MNVYTKEPDTSPTASVIWMHGLGADASDMAGLASQYPISALPVRHVFMNAPVRPVTINGGMHMPAWYDIVGFELTDREDGEGIKESEKQINAVIQSQLETGMTEKQIILAGFSQGAAMALHTALNRPQAIGGVVSLSGYLPLASECQFHLPRETPFFMGYGRFDNVVLPEWTNYSCRFLESRGYHDLTIKDYPMEHSICQSEINDLDSWLKRLLGEKA
ncbi:phospholipase/carboxylesterase [Legionella quinlivanii]|uniref:Phospholipase/carboxylesterase n=1 Tax=Legionella quinlivanii TaxID=45073 RepID=A0A0W0XYG3_9GAMM|nr:alpha/beta hydrolase-fold protein [Legionella quinlivanii]KTD49657.1 phospholipase/carboxylesterase [Legionella quinlivanii]MCW8451977.1 alpha/beta hydrolase [Legionella quinlivanii]SEG30823.1 phospholipase/carboxylesterase [Legionella quinlivanii DSM 21216]STY09826.1 phospholipase/carboxylesterase [Legionella quinlivanii]